MKNFLLKAARFSVVGLLFLGAGCLGGGPSTSTNGPGDNAVNAVPSVPAGQVNVNGVMVNGNVNGAGGTGGRTYSLVAVTDSKQYGSVSLVDLPGNRTRVDITLIGKDDKALPAAIYAGTCKTQQAEEQYALNPVVNGKSSTTLNVNTNAIVGSTPQALKIRRNATETNVPFAACADLK